MPAAVPAERPARLTVGAVGAGRVGAVLLAALARAGHTATAVSAVSRASLRRAEQLVPQARVLPPDEVAASCRLLLLAVPDDVLPDLAAGLAAAGSLRAGTLVAHTSGARGVSVLDPLTRVGALPLALHPAMTFTGTDVDLHRLAGTAFGVTAPDELRLAAEALVVEMGAEPVWVPEEQRPLYHAALALGANSLSALVAQSVELLTAAGIDQPAPLLAPLLGAALDNALRLGDAALTGPVARGDAGTVRAHLATLDGPAREAYLVLARLTAGRALAAGLLPAVQAEALLDVLADDGSRR